MSNEHPVLLIHTAPWCGACKSLLQPNNMSKITKLLKELNPEAEIKIISNKHFNDTNKTDDIPTVNYIPAFPMLMVMNSSNCSRRGSMNNVRIFNHNWDGNQINKNEKSESIEAFLRKNIAAINEEIDTNKAREKIVNDKNRVKSSTSNNSNTLDSIVQNRGKNENKRRERTFRLVGLNE